MTREQRELMEAILRDSGFNAEQITIALNAAQIATEMHANQNAQEALLTPGNTLTFAAPQVFAPQPPVNAQAVPTQGVHDVATDELAPVYHTELLPAIVGVKELWDHDGDCLYSDLRSVNSFFKEIQNKPLKRSLMNAESPDSNAQHYGIVITPDEQTMVYFKCYIYYLKLAETHINEKLRAINHADQQTHLTTYISVGSRSYREIFNIATQVFANAENLVRLETDRRNAQQHRI